ncbi:hypothetical protein ONZ45_g19323 [Pleurotus djamor]|nr:hypothetical protein ONZ45_g19323 [Pleurotus djamor]
MASSRSAPNHIVGIAIPIEEAQARHGHPSPPKPCEDAASDISEDPLLLKGASSVTSTVKFKRDTQSRGSSAPLRAYRLSSAEAPPLASASAFELSRRFGFEVKDILFISKILNDDVPKTVAILTVMKAAVETSLQLLLSAPMTP